MRGHLWSHALQGAASTNKGNLQRKLEQIAWVEDEIGEVRLDVLTNATVDELCNR